MDKIVSTAKWLFKAFSVLRIVLTSFSAIGIIALSAGILAAEKIAEIANQSNSSLSISIGVLKLWVADAQMTSGELREFAVMVIIIIAVILVVSLFAIHLFQCVLRDMKEGCPFSQNIPVRIRQSYRLRCDSAFICI